ncbi:MAG: IS66 family transposase [Acidobacteria bacterium]|nr:IS66 family transposase [Acidobacteriota bacterium]
MADNGEAIPKEIDLTEEQLQELIRRLDQNCLTPTDRDLIKGVLGAHVWLSRKLQEREMSLKRLFRLFFQKRTESSRNILKKVSEATEEKEPQPGAVPPAESSSGHGRRPASQYTGARRTHCAHPELAAESGCPACHRGRVFPLRDPGIFIHFKARPPIDADIYESDRFRCGSCGAVFTAPIPAGVPAVTWDPTAKSMAAILRYGAGVPHYRLEKLQQQLGVPISDATLFDLSEQVADAAFIVYRHLLLIAAQGELFHADDTTMRILALMKEDKDKDDARQRKGIYTTAIISIVEEHEICLFFTGRRYAGENLDEFLKLRSKQMQAPMLMADAAVRNLPKTLQVILLKCLTHGRRQFVDVYESFPAEVTHIIQEIAIIYHNDQQAHEFALTPDLRLAYHQEHSGPVTERLHHWCLALINEKKVEPNSALGKAIRYLDKHWDGLTQFLRIPGAPISNDLTERLLKRAVLHRKNSLFYLTEHGAAVGDILMTLIQTAVRAGANPFDYLTEIQRHHAQARDHPDHWLPWNYRDSIPGLLAGDAAA